MTFDLIGKNLNQLNPYFLTISNYIRRLLETSDKKGLSFLNMKISEVRQLLIDEITEWNDSYSFKNELNEILDIMVCCTLLYTFITHKTGE